MIAKFIVTLAFADAQTLKQADFRESAQEVGGQNAEAVIDAPEEGDRRQLELKRHGAIRRKTTTTTTTTTKKPLSRRNAVKGRKLDEEDSEAETEGESEEEDSEAETEDEADKEDPEAETEGESDEEDPEAETEGESDEEDPEAETEGESEGGLENDRRQLESACVDKQATDDTCLSSWSISRAKDFKVGAKCSYWKTKNYCLNDYFTNYQDSKRAMKDCCALTCSYCGDDEREAGPETPTFAENISEFTDNINAVADNVDEVKETVKGIQESAEGVGNAVGLPVDQIKNKSKEKLDAGKNKAKELAREGGNKVKEAVTKGSKDRKEGGSKKKRGNKRRR